MKKLLMVTMIALTSLTSFGQEIKIESYQIYDGGNTTLSYHSKIDSYILLIQNGKYDRITDLKNYVFTSKLELVEFLNMVDKFTTISNYKSEFGDNMLSAKVNNNEYRFTLNKREMRVYNPELEKLQKQLDNIDKTLSLRKTIQLREEIQFKMLSLPKFVKGDDYIEMNIFVSGGWTTFTNERVINIKNALNKF